jgi:copper chaperone CopZ
MKNILTALTLGSLLCVPLARAGDPCCPTTRATDSQATLKVTGMTCDQCAAGVKNSLTKLNGVKAADVSLDKGQAAVTFDSAKVTTDKLIAAVNKAGGSRHTFKAELAEQFKCSSCGKTYDKAGSCCGAPTKKVK